MRLSEKAAFLFPTKIEKLGINRSLLQQQIPKHPTTRIKLRANRCKVLANRNHFLKLMAIFQLQFINQKPKNIMKRFSIKTVLFLVAVAFIMSCTAPKPKDEGWIQLFNGKDLNDWNIKITGFQIGRASCWERVYI